MDFKLDDAGLKAVLSKSILDALTPERRDEIIGKAVERLLTVKVSDRYDSPTTLQAAFDEAVRAVASAVARDMLASRPDIKAKITEMFLTAWEKQTSGANGDKLVEAIGSAIYKTFDSQRW